MKGTIITIAGLACLALFAGSASAHTWKSADGSKSFDAEFVKLEGELLTVKRSTGKTMTFKLSILSEEDQTFAKEEAERMAKAAEEAAAAAELANAKLPKALKGKLVRLEGKSLKKFELSESSPPRYYVLYYSASW